MKAARDLRAAPPRALRDGYSPAVRRFELASIAVFALAMLWLLTRCARAACHAPWISLLAAMVGFVIADFSSGFVHWAADTWGTPEWPLVGKALIRPFREHHLDPKEITRHGFVETNGNNCFISIVPTVFAALLPQSWFFVQVLIFAGALAILGTNQFHKWSHEDDSPRGVRWLQRLHLILPPEHHAVHHAAPFTRSYCITVGWMNEPLRRIRFFPAMERIVSAVTGLIPREDDLGKQAANGDAPSVARAQGGFDRDAVGGS